MPVTSDETVCDRETRETRGVFSVWFYAHESRDRMSGRNGRAKERSLQIMRDQENE